VAGRVREAAAPRGPGRRAAGRRALLGGVLALATLAAASAAGGAREVAAGDGRGDAPAAVASERRPVPEVGPGRPLSRFVTRLGTDGTRRLAASAWWGGSQTSASGERVTVFLSTAYAADTSAAQRWADFFASLVHGSELSSARVYVAPLDEVHAICGGDGVLGCYDGRAIVTIGEAAGSVPATAVAAHEYGHHIAMNRLNAPWRAIDWGTKRWASHARVCARAGSGTAFPGDEGARYALNPGEAFAEAYRVLNEVRAGASTFDWSIIDYSFRPDGAALARLEQDVLRPWTAPTTRLLRKVPARHSTTWTRRVATPLDGALRVRLRLQGGGHDVALLSGDRRRVLARGLWSSGNAKVLEHRLCGERAVTVRVTRQGAPAPFEISLTAP
jgi:hypothetical protein